MLLFELWKSIAEGYIASAQELNAKLFSNIGKISIYAALDSSKKLHLIVSDISDSDFDKLYVKGLQINKCKLVINDNQLKSYIDIFCDITVSDKLHTPFIAFCVDLIAAIDKDQNNVYQAIRKLFYKWKYFWDNRSITEFSENWLKGLFGELIILKNIINTVSKNAVLTWQGPYGKDVDFQGFNCGIEVKTTSTRPAIITVNNIKQLDNSNFDYLYLTVVTLDNTKQGISINQIIDDIIQVLELNDQILLDAFYERLTSSGYYLYEKEKYEEYTYSLNSVEWYFVDDEFPALTFSKLKDLLDYRITNIKYQIEMLDLHYNEINDKTIIKFLYQLTGLT